MTVSAYTLLRDAEHRAEVAELAELLRFQTESALYRAVIKRALAEARARAAELAALELQQEAAEAIEEQALDDTLELSLSLTAPPTEPDPDPPDPNILEWLEEEEEEEEELNPWRELDEEERAGVLLDLTEHAEAIEEDASRAAFGELRPRELARLVARVFFFLVRLVGVQRAAAIRATIERVSQAEALPAELWRAVLEVAGMLYPLRE